MLKTFFHTNMITSVSRSQSVVGTSLSTHWIPQRTYILCLQCVGDCPNIVGVIVYAIIFPDFLVWTPWWMCDVTYFSLDETDPRWILWCIQPPSIVWCEIWWEIWMQRQFRYVNLKKNDCGIVIFLYIFRCCPVFGSCFECCLERWWTR